MADTAALAAVLAAASLLSFSLLLFFRKPLSSLFRRTSLLPDIEKARVSDDPRADVSPPSPLKTFSWSEIQIITNNFSTVLGEGGYSKVFLADVSGGAAAVKVHVSAAGSERLLRAFRQELDLLCHVIHPHIVRLLGYSIEKEEGALVLEYVPNGTLHDKLHTKQDSVPFKARTKIALQIAQAIKYLHEFQPRPIIHCDLKSSNILLDFNLDAKLCDFGSALEGFESTVAPNFFTGSPGYVDPHYLRTGLVSKKGDVYSYGVILMELLTGEEAFCAEKEEFLTVSVREGLRVDGRLGGEYEREKAAEMAALAVRCTEEQPGLRPSMAEVVSCMEGIRGEKP